MSALIEHLEAIVLAIALVAGAWVQRLSPVPVPKASWTERLRDAGALVLAVFSTGVVRTLVPLEGGQAFRVLPAIGAVFVFDFVLYVLHRLGHGAWLRMHIAHHLPTHFDVGMALRDSAVHLVVYSGLFVGFARVLALSKTEAVVVSSVLLLFQVWTHTRTWVSLGLWDWVFIGPRHHALHHLEPLKAQRIHNLGGIFCLWDQIFGTYVHPPVDAPFSKRPGRRASPGFRQWVGV